MDIKAIVVGGILPAVFLGIATCLMKLSLRHGISISSHLTFVGAVVLAVGLVSAVVAGNWHSNVQSGFASSGMGLVWSFAVIAMAYGMSTLNLPVSIVAPLSNSNAIVAVLLSALLFKEWQSLNVVKVLLGTCLIVVGASIVSASSE